MENLTEYNNIQENNQTAVQETNVYSQPIVNNEQYFVDASELDAKQLQEIQELIKSQEEQRTNEININDYVNAGGLPNVNTNTPKNNYLENIVKDYLGALLDIDKEAIKYINPYDKEEVLGLIKVELEPYFYPAKEVKILAEFINRGGKMSDFIEHITPIDFSVLNDEEVIFAYYKGKMDDAALKEYLEMLNASNKLKSKADAIRKEVNVIELSPEEALEKQKETQKQMKMYQEAFANSVSTAVKNLSLNFRSTDEKQKFVDSLTVVEPFYNENNELVYNGTLYSYLLNTDIEALVLSAYYLWTHEENKEKIKSNKEMIDNIKKNLTEFKNIGLTGFQRLM